MPLKLESLRVFCVVAEKGTLSRAARALGRTPSAVSMMLSQLEDQIGAPLFETDRKNRLTPLGHLVLEEANRATEVFETSADAIRRHAISTAGIVRIAAVPSATESLLPKVVAKFRTTHPDVRLEISDADSNAVRRRIQRSEADIGLFSARPGDVDDSEAILTDDLGIVCQEGGPVHAAHLASDVRSDWSLLDREPLIANPLCRLVDHPLIDALLTKSTLEARNTTAILSFVRQGFGISILPFDAVRNQPHGVEFFVPSNPVSRRELRKIRHEGGGSSLAVATFWEMLNVT